MLPGSVVRRDGAVGRTLLLLRRRRCPDVDGGEPRRADQRQPHQGGRRHRRRPDRGRLPVLPGDALRRAHLRAGRRPRPRGGRGPRRRADAAGLGEGRVRHPRRPPPAAAAVEPAARRPGPSRSPATTPRPPRRVTETADVGPAAAASATSGGSSLFDLDDDEPETVRRAGRACRDHETRLRLLALRPRAPTTSPSPSPRPGAASVEPVETTEDTDLGRLPLRPRGTPTATAEDLRHHRPTNLLRRPSEPTPAETPTPRSRRAAPCSTSPPRRTAAPPAPTSAPSRRPQLRRAGRDRRPELGARAEAEPEPEPEPEPEAKQEPKAPAEPACRAPDGRRHQRGRLAVRPLNRPLTCGDVIVTPFDVS